MFSRRVNGLKLAVLAFSAGFLSACSQMQNDSLFTDAQESACPPGCTDSLKPDDTQIAIKFQGGSVLLPASASRVDVSGDCYTSLYKDNAIYVQLKHTSSNTYVATNRYRYWGISSGSNVKCKNGKFDLSVDMSGVAGPDSYEIEVQLFAYDENGGTHTNDSEGKHYLTVVKTNQ